jgi:hypothetical protein
MEQFMLILEVGHVDLKLERFKITPIKNPSNFDMSALGVYTR